MRQITVLLIGLLIFACGTSKEIATPPPADTSSVDEFTKDLQAYPGYFPFYWDAEAGKIWLEINQFDQEFLYVNALSAGVGSNDIGLDRGQLGDERVVKFIRSGPKVLLIQPNLSFRAVSDNEEEKKSVAEAFAQSAIGGFRVEVEEEGRVIVDITDFLMRDAHGVSDRLRRNRQGSYRPDPSRSIIYLDRTKNFPKNSEFEAMITFAGSPEGRYIRSVTPSADAITVRMHHSFLELPDANYEMRVFDPRSGFNAMSYQDYATPIESSLVKRFIVRHRLEKKDPTAAISEPVEPIIYYLDRGAPEPIKSALLEGASWWNQAFEAAGYKDAFRVEVLPAGADPLDARYNVIQWVHRSTRGWSYGSSVTDPRTGEIIKGHVSLGSLRVRQDFLIAQGMVEAYVSGKNPSKEMLNLALARLRQLSAHEVGHTIGLAHNFAASTNDRASVMDYPHPLISLDESGKIVFNDVYDVGIGAWDKRTVLYGYQDFAEESDEAQGLLDILAENNKMGLRYISDQDARPQSGSHPYAHLWDNGANAAEELGRVLSLRAKAMENFGEHNIPENAPMGTLEEVLAPLYFAHRYQVEATVKLVAGSDYTYAARGDGQTTNKIVAAGEQKAALDHLMKTLSAENLAIPERILDMIPPRPMGYQRGRENFNIKTGFILDPVSIAESSADFTLGLLFNSARANRLISFHARDNQYPGLGQMIDQVIDGTWKTPSANSYHASIDQAVQLTVVRHLMNLANNPGSSGQAKAMANYKLQALADWIEAQKTSDEGQMAHYHYTLSQIQKFQMNPSMIPLPPAQKLPDGSPIGMGCMH